MRAPHACLASFLAIVLTISCNQDTSTFDDSLAELAGARINIGASVIILQPGQTSNIEAIITNSFSGLLPVLFASSTPGVATVVATERINNLLNATVTARSPGEAWVYAHIVRGHPEFGRDSVRVTVQGVQQPQIGILRLEPAVNPLELLWGDTFAIIVDVQNVANPSVTYSSTSPNSVRFVKRGINAWVEILSTMRDPITLRATVDGTNASVSQLITRNAETIFYSVTLSEDAFSLFATENRDVGCAFRNTRSGYPFAWDSTTWSSSNAAIATVSAAGKVTGVAPGQAFISCGLRPGTRRDTATVTVRSLNLTVTPNPVVLRTGGVAQLQPQITDNAGVPVTGQRVIYASSNNLVARVDSPNVLVGVEAGTATVRASVAAFPSVFADVPVTIQPLACGPTGTNVVNLRSQLVTDPGNQAAAVNMPANLAISVARVSNVFTVSAPAPFGTVTGPVDPLGSVCALFLSGTATINGSSVPVELAGAYPPGGVAEWTFRVLMPAGTVTFRLVP